MAAPKKLKKAKKARTDTKTKKITAGPGPVTLAEAKALAIAKDPTLAPSVMSKGAVPPASPANVGAEREKLEKERRKEIARRVREYKATMVIMKKRGARKALPKGAAASFVPLQIFAEGDSWFEYPALLFGGGIIPRLENRLGVPILNLAHAGDEVRYMLGVEQRKILTEKLREGCSAGGDWDVLLFSGGGNDVVDDPMALWVRDWDPNLSPAQHINQQRFDIALALVRAGYEDLINLRNKFSSRTRLVFHGYDFAIPDGRGICYYGPWLKPTFDLRGFPTRAAAQEVVKAMLQQFANMLLSLANTHAKVTFINGQGTLVPQTTSWHNELHPKKAGFETFADIFHREIKQLYPNQVA